MFSPFFRKLLLLASPVCFAGLPLRAAPVTDLYEITSGTYTVVGGFVGVWESDLPFSEQSFIELTIDRALSTAEMRILGDDLGQFEFLGFGSPFIDGIISGDRILFHDATLVSDFGQSGTLDYSVWLQGDRLTLNGQLTSDPVCCDIPYDFSHSEVEAVAPEPTTAMLLALGFMILAIAGHRSLELVKENHSRHFHPCGTAP